MSVAYIDRKNTDCSKWDNLMPMFGEQDLQAMWVADMDFRCPDCVIKALQNYVSFGVFGYYKPAETYKSAFIDWERDRHGYEVRREWIRFAPGVVPAINWLINALTSPGDAVIVLTPVYYPFMDGIRNNGRRLVCSPLINQCGNYHIDYEDFEKKIKAENVRMLILSSPHNPVGRVWKQEELKRLLEISRRYGVYVISDEIHHDIILNGNRHIPSATVGDYDDLLVTLTAPSKTFNLAGCQNSFVIIPDAGIREKYDSFKGMIRIEGGNSFGYIAAEAAYRGGLLWLEEVLSIIEGNYRYLKATLEAALPEIVISPLEGTYLLWIDFRAYLKAGELRDFMQKKCGLALDYGDWFGGEAYGTCVRMNLATSRELVRKAAESMITQLSLENE